MRIDTKRLWRLFITINIALMFSAIWITVPERVFIFQGQTAAFRLQERQLSIMEDNLRMYETNVALLSDYQIEGGIIIQPPGYMGTIFTDVRNMLYLQGLTELEFYASEQGVHHMGTQHVLETRASFMIEGNYDDINAFLHDLANHYRYLRFERIQISEEIFPTRLWLTISIYESE